MSILTKEQLAEGEALAAKATPGPWMAWRMGNQLIDVGSTNYLVGASELRPVPRAWNPQSIAGDNQNVTRLRDEDADFIVWARNNIDALIATARASDALSAEVDDISAEIDQLHEDTGVEVEAALNVNAQLTEARAEIARLEAILRGDHDFLIKRTDVLTLSRERNEARAECERLRAEARERAELHRVEWNRLQRELEICSAPLDREEKRQAMELECARLRTDNESLRKGDAEASDIEDRLGMPLAEVEAEIMRIMRLRAKLAALCEARGKDDPT